MVFTSLIVLKNVLEEGALIFSSSNELFLIRLHLIVLVLLVFIVIILSSLRILRHASEDRAEASRARLYKKHEWNTDKHNNQTTD